MPLQVNGFRVWGLWFGGWGLGFRVAQLTAGATANQLHGSSMVLGMSKEV